MTEQEQRALERQARREWRRLTGDTIIDNLAHLINAALILTAIYVFLVLIGH